MPSLVREQTVDAIVSHVLACLRDFYAEQRFMRGDDDAPRGEVVRDLATAYCTAHSGEAVELFEALVLALSRQVIGLADHGARRNAVRHAEVARPILTPGLPGERMVPGTLSQPAPAPLGLDTTARDRTLQRMRERIDQRTADIEREMSEWVETVGEVKKPVMRLTREDGAILWMRGTKVMEGLDVNRASILALTKDLNGEQVVEDRYTKLEAYELAGAAARAMRIKYEVLNGSREAVQ